MLIVISTAGRNDAAVARECAEQEIRIESILEYLEALQQAGMMPEARSRMPPQ
jgi:hypothetical protein